MPFDGATFGGNPALNGIDTVLRLLATEDRWCKGALETTDGRRCLIGAMQASDARLVLEPIVLSAIKEVTGRSYWRVKSFNDHHNTTHETVLRVLHQARDWIVTGQVGAPARAGGWPKTVLAHVVATLPTGFWRA